MKRNSSGSSGSSGSERQWLELKVVELSYRGHSQREISDKLQISIATISRIMHKLNVQAREEIKTWIDYKTPWEYQCSLMLLQYMQKKVIEIGESTKDERVQLEAMARLADIDAQKRQLLSDTFVINSAIASLQKQRKYEIIQRQQQQQQAAVSYNRSNSTTTRTKRHQQQVSPEKPEHRQMKLDNSDADTTTTTTTHEPPEESSNG